MKKRNFFIPYLVVLMLFSTISACGSRSEHESSRDVVRKTTTTTERPVIQEEQTTTTTTTEKE